MTVLPFGYGTALLELLDLEVWLRRHHHPEYVRRLVAWLDHGGGAIGVGGGWRADGTQPVEEGFAPEGKSFHQNQRYDDGYIGAAAVDLVARNPGRPHRSPRWDEVPAQGSDEARRWGLHCNVGRPGQVGSEPWHMQPVEIDGWQTWRNAGSPAPVAGYPLPNRPAPDPHPPPSPPPDPEGMEHLMTGTYTVAKTSNGAYWIGTPLGHVHAVDTAAIERWLDRFDCVDLATGLKPTTRYGIAVVDDGDLTRYMGRRIA